MSARSRNLPGRRTLYTVSGEVGSETELVSTALGTDATITGTGISLESCVLTRTAIIHAEGLSALRCKFDTIDAAGAALERSGWRECQVDSSRFTGAKLNEAFLDGMLFHECKMNLMQCQSSKLRRSRFSNCDLRGAYFNRSDLTGTTFEGSDLTEVDFSGAVLNGCDFRRATIEDIRVSPDQLSGVIVTSDQALYLSRLFGLVIRE